MIFSINVCPLSIKSAPQNKSGSPDTQVRATKPIISQNVLKICVFQPVLTKMNISEGIGGMCYVPRHP